MYQCLKPPGFCLPLALIGALPAAAQDDSGLDKHLTLLGVPSAVTAPHGSVFASLAYATQRVNSSEDEGDGSLALGLGLGDINDGLGIQLTSQIVSLENDFADSGFFGLKLGRRISAGQTPLYLGLSVGNFGAWGNADDNDTTVDAMLTGFHLFDTGGSAPTPVMFSLGYGSHVRDRFTEPGGFAGIGVGLSPWLASSVSWYGDYGTLGVSWSPPSNRKLSITASVVDVTDAIDERRGVFSVNFVLPKAFGG
ncbi:hypothetical protein Q4543_20775 [Salipiger sp. 1_MG-2023]|uniref:hypothetical protein n=1 Tax=Salipiger sp. 1_MG-2023 TaxID=3062665 RepID=UPI0026E1568F|nr:hypothetical protein [Salipiger sp. 1_MG-2023]MDO6587950.1 hypothetical protein [Salipiger sp. 1_MG-2023]